MDICRRARRSSKEICSTYDRNAEKALQYNKKLLSRFFRDILLTLIIIIVIIFVGINIFEFLREKADVINSNIINELLLISVLSFCFCVSGLIIICDFISPPISPLLHIMGHVLLTFMFMYCSKSIHGNFSEKSEMFRNAVLICDTVIISFTLFLIIMRFMGYLNFGTCISVFKAKKENKKITTLSICSDCGQVDYNYSKICSKCSSENIKAFDEIYSEWNNQQTIT